MLRTGALVAMRQQHDEGGRLVPFDFGGHDELVNDDLRHVDKIAVLRFPQHQCIGGLHVVAVFKAQHTRF